MKQELFEEEEDTEMEEEEGVDPTLHAISGPDPVVISDTGSSPFLMSPIPSPPSFDPPSFDYMPMDQDPSLALMLDELLDTSINPISHSTPPASPTAPRLSTPNPPPPLSPPPLSTAPTLSTSPLLASPTLSLPGPSNSPAPNKGGRPAADPMAAAEVQLVTELFQDKNITVELVRQLAKDNEPFKVIFDRKCEQVLLDNHGKMPKREIERRVTKSLKSLVSRRA